MKRSCNIALLLDWYDYRIHRGVASVAHDNGWQLICPKNYAYREWALETAGYDGCISLATDRRTVAVLEKTDLPSVDIGLGPAKVARQRVVTDNLEIGRMAAAHFREHGYLQVLALPSGRAEMNAERLDGLLSAMTDLGGRVEVVGTQGYATPDLIPRLRKRIAKRRQLVGSGSVAFFAYNDNIAAQVIALCLSAGLSVPDDVAVLGVDNDDLTNTGLTVGLSSIDSDLEGLGVRAANLLRDMLTHPQERNDNEIIRHPPKGLVERLSTDSLTCEDCTVSDALHWISSHLKEGIQATDVADAMGISQQGLQKRFKRYHVRSPGQEIRRQRLRAAAKLLQITDSRLHSIAVDCGYYCEETMIRNFRAEYGLTPGQYRRQFRSSP